MKKESQVQNKSGGRTILILVLVLMIVATSAFGIFAWARYQTTVKGESTAYVAKWNFKVTGDTTQTGEVVFAFTRDDGNTTVAEGTIAPGTSGKMDITVDVTGTQTDLIYTISGSTEDMPRNLKLYSDAARTQEISVLGQKFSKGNYLKVSDIGNGEKKIPETIYWEWPFETGEKEDEKIRNNAIDTEDMGKAMTMLIKVEGKQLNGAPALADIVQIGDYVNYNANSNGEKTLTQANFEQFQGGVTLSDTISTADAFGYDTEKETPKAQWRVLSVNRQTKAIELMSVDTTVQTVTLDGANGFLNAETALNMIGGLYDEGKGAKANSGRSITKADIEQYSSYEKPKVGVREYKNGFFYKQVKDAQGNVTGFETTVTEATEENPVEIVNAYYSYSVKGFMENNTIFNMFCNISNNIEKDKSYWLATRVLRPYTAYCDYDVYKIVEDSIGGSYVYASNKSTKNPSMSVVPVISLNDNIQTTGLVDGVWQLKVD